MCRTACVGGQLSPLRAWEDAAKIRGQRHVLFAIHGYNNTFCEAQKSFEKFYARQVATAASGQDWTFGASFVQVFWPGDGDWGLLRPLFYPKAIPLADQTSTLLAEIIRDLHQFAGGELTVDFLTHSMGARVAIGAISKIRGLAGVQVRRCVHMAGAIPVSRLQNPKDDFGEGIREETRVGRGTSFHSSGDDVLAYAFPAGETLDCKDEGFAPVALGHRDWLAGHSIPNLNQLDASHAGHGQYWDGTPTLLGQVRDALDLGVAGSSVVPSHVSPTASSPEGRRTESRSTQTRSTGTQDDPCPCN